MSSLIYAWTLAQRSQYFAQQVDQLRDLQRQVREAEGRIWIARIRADSGGAESGATSVLTRS